MRRTCLVLCLILNSLPLMTVPSSAQPYVNSWHASSGVYPNASCHWTLGNTSSVAPMLGPAKLTLTTTAGSQNQFYFQANADLSLPALWIIEVKCRYVSGSTGSTARAPINVQFQRGQTQVSALHIGAGEIFLQAGDAVRGMTAAVPTSDAMHTYRIELNGSAIQVFQDGALKLTGVTFSSGSVAAGPRIIWGEGSSLASGVSEWEFVSHNGSASNDCPTPVLVTTWGRLKGTSYR